MGGRAGEVLVVGMDTGGIRRGGGCDGCVGVLGSGDIILEWWSGAVVGSVDARTGNFGGSSDGAVGLLYTAGQNFWLAGEGSSGSRSAAAAVGVGL